MSFNQRVAIWVVTLAGIFLIVAMTVSCCVQDSEIDDRPLASEVFRTDEGIIRKFKDGSVTCYYFDGYRQGGLSCVIIPQ